MRSRITTIKMEISSSDVKAKVLIKTVQPVLVKEFTFITPKEELPGKCFFTWIERIKK